jgi:glycosyltransferase involved in cell wall biosynthesis
MKILYDYQIFSSQKYGGISRYFSELFASYLKSKRLEFSLGVKYSDNLFLNKIIKLEEASPKLFINKSYSELFNGLDFRGKWRLYNLLCLKPSIIRKNRAKSIELLIESDFDVFHPTYYDSYFLNYLKDKPYVITVHDMIHEKASEIIHPKDPILSNKKTVIKNADGVIAVSQSTKDDLIELYGIAPEKINVIYHGFSEKNSKNKKIAVCFPSKYLLYVGGRKHYKNFIFFVKSIVPLFRRYKDLFLVCTGLPFSKDELIELNKQNILDRVISYSMNDSDIAYAYRHALAFIFPSLYEGFGIPLIEAFSLGCPVICSDINVFKEVAQDAALYFDPQNSDSIYTIISNYIDNVKEIKNNLILRGIDRSKSFSWDKAALLTQKVYEQVYNNSTALN